jgi:hypothetical protein
MIYLLILLASLTWVLLPYISKHLSYFLVFTLLFSQGLVELAGINSAYLKFGSEILILSLFLRQLISGFTGSGKLEFTGFTYYCLFLIVIFLSALFNPVNLIEIILFIKSVSIYYFLYIALINEDFSKKNIQRFIAFFIVLFAIQLVAVGIKFSIIGISEKGGIGTLSLSSGSLSTILPLFACAYLIASYIYTKEIKYIVLIVCFALFGLIGHKRAIVFYIPLIFLIIQTIYSLRDVSFLRLIKQKSFIINMGKFVLLSILIVYGLVRAHPTLNPDDKIGGEFSFAFLMDYSTEYLTQKSITNPYVLGRTEAPAVVLKKVSEYGPSHILIGLGPGEILESSFLPKNEEKLLNEYGIGYGGRTGLIYIFMQVGLIGTFLFFMIPFLIYRRIDHIFKNTNSTYIQTLALGCLGSFMVYFIDMFTYSPIMIEAGALVAVFFAMPALIIQYYNQN